MLCYILLGYPYIFLSENIVVVVCLALLYIWDGIHDMIIWSVGKIYVLYNKTSTQWTTWVDKDTQVLDKVATKGTMFIWLSFCMCTRRKPPRDLEIEHVSPIVAFMCNHMLLWLWLSQLHWEDPCIGLQVNWKWGN